MTTTHECRCGRPTRDAAYVCDTCADDLARALGDIPWLEEELAITISRQKGIDYRSVGGGKGGKGGKKASERPHPANMGASDAKHDLRNLLTSWARLCIEENVPHSSPDNQPRSDNLSTVSAWLLWCVDGLTLRDIGSDAHDEITEAVTRCRRIIDRQPDKQYLGECDVCDGGDLYAYPGGTWATCRTCDSRVDATAIRNKLLAELDDRLCTAAEIADLCVYLGLKDDRDRVRNRINQWHKRKRIDREHAFSDDPVFRFGIVWRLLVHHDQERGERTA